MELREQRQVEGTAWAPSLLCFSADVNFWRGWALIDRGTVLSLTTDGHR